MISSHREDKYKGNHTAVEKHLAECRPTPALSTPSSFWAWGSWSKFKKKVSEAGQGDEQAKKEIPRAKDCRWDEDHVLQKCQWQA